MLEAEREAVVTAGRRVAERGLVVGTSGNLSVRSGDLVAVSPTGAALGELEPELVPVIDLNGAVVEGDLAPTSETALHTLIYRTTDARAIAHVHAMASTAVSCTHDELPVIHYYQLMLGGPVRTAPFAAFGTEELAKNVTAALDGSTAALMQNHGSVAHGTSLAEACDRVELLEWLCELYSRSLALGTPRQLTQQDIEAVIHAALSRGYGATKPAG